MNRRYVTDNTWQVPVVNPVEVQIPYAVDTYATMVAQRNDDVRAARQRYAESAFRDNAKSGAGAVGAYQIMPITYKDYLSRGRGVEGDLLDPEYNRKVRDFAMGIVPRDLGDMWSDNDAEQVRLAKQYAGYNWGAGSLKRYLRKQKAAGVDISNSLDWLEGLPKETRDYVRFVALGEDVPDTSKTMDAYRKAWGKFSKQEFPEDTLGRRFDAGGLIEKYGVDTVRSVINEFKKGGRKRMFSNVTERIKSDAQQAAGRNTPLPLRGEKPLTPLGYDVASYAPIVGDAIQAGEAIDAATIGNYGEAALLGSLLFVPNAIEKAVRAIKPLRHIKKNTNAIEPPTSHIVAAAPQEAQETLLHSAPVPDIDTATGELLFPNGARRNMTANEIRETTANIQQRIREMESDIARARGERPQVDPGHVETHISEPSVGSTLQVEAPTQLQDISIDELHNIRRNWRLPVEERRMAQAEIRRRARQNLLPPEELNSMSIEDLYRASQSVPDYDAFTEMNVGLNYGEPDYIERYDYLRNINDTLRSRGSALTEQDVPTTFRNFDQAMAYRAAAERNRPVLDKINLNMRPMIADAIIKEKDIPKDLNIYDLLNTLLEKGHIPETNKHVQRTVKERYDTLRRFHTDTEFVDQYLNRNAYVNGADESGYALKQLLGYYRQKATGATSDAIEEDAYRLAEDAMRRYPSMTGKEREDIEAIINKAYELHKGNKPTGLDKLIREQEEAEVRDIMKKRGHNIDETNLDILYDPYNPEYVDLAKTFRDAGIYDLPADIKHMTWFQGKEKNAFRGQKKAALQSQLLTYGLPRQVAIAEHNTSPQSLLISTNAALRYPGGYGTKPNQVSILQHKRVDAPLYGSEKAGDFIISTGNNLQLNTASIDPITERLKLDISPDFDSGLHRQELEDIYNELHGLDYSAKADIFNNPAFSGTISKMRDFFRKQNALDYMPFNKRIEQINRTYGETLVPAPALSFRDRSFARDMENFLGSILNGNQRALEMPRVTQTIVKHEHGGFLNNPYSDNTLLHDYNTGGKIHIKPENRGKFTAKAKRAGQGVQQYARHVLANKDNYPSSTVAQARFAKAAASWQHGDGGLIERYGVDAVRKALEKYRTIG